jgi:hypothetical protein
MSNLPKNIRVTGLKKSFVGTSVPKQEKGNEGNTGRYYHDMMGVSKAKGVDIEKLDMEVKTRKRGSKSPHTTGTMTYDDIIASPWEDTIFAEKRQRVFEATHDDTFSSNKIVGETVIDMTKPDIQDLLKRDYEIARAKLAARGPGSTGTIVGGEFGILELRSGNTWAHRIPDSGYRKIKSMAASTFDKLFEYK